MRFWGAVMLFELKSVFLNEGESKQLQYELDIRDIEIDGIFPFISPVKVTAEAHNRASLVTLELKCTYGVDRPCDRCGTDCGGVTVSIFSHKLVQTLVDETNDDYIEAPDFTLELDDIVISDILLAYPRKFLCREDCKGLCQHCGKNLNFEECDCEKTTVDPRLEILKQFMED